jgi:5-methylcytosine-specific restriction endonuclease McrA
MISKAQKKYAIDHEYCEICGAPGADVHHIIFRSQQGTDEPENLITLCRPHHEMAHGTEAKWFREVLQYRKKCL